MRRVFGFILLAIIALGAFGVYVAKAEPDWFLRMRYPLEYRAIINAHSDNYGLEPALLAAVIYTESKFDPRAQSAAGAIGLMQLLPDTAQGIADHTGGGNYTTADLYDPELNIRYGAWYLARLQKKYRNHPQSLELALAAYNAGPGVLDTGPNWDRRTTGGDYSNDTWARARALAPSFGGVGQAQPATTTPASGVTGGSSSAAPAAPVLHKLEVRRGGAGGVAQSSHAPRCARWLRSCRAFWRLAKHA
jgi:soluble lytic murein transglycosylase